jgi:hypothetical protein
MDTLSKKQSETIGKLSNHKPKANTMANYLANLLETVPKGLASAIFQKCSEKEERMVRELDTYKLEIGPRVCLDLEISTQLTDQLLLRGSLGRLDSSRASRVNHKAEQSMLDGLERERNHMASLFSKKMSMQTLQLDKRRKKHKQALLNMSHRYMEEKEAKRFQEFDRINETKRVIISDRLSQSRLESAKRVEENKRSQANFEFVKRNLSPLIEEVGHKHWQDREERFAGEMLESKRSQYRSVDLQELKQHGLRVDCVLKRREIEDILKRSEATPRQAYDPMKLKKYKDNPVFFKQKEFNDNHAKSLKYADTVLSKIEQRSSLNAIRNWEEGQHYNNFGYYYKQEVQKRKQNRLLNWDPNSYLHESTEIGRRVHSLHPLATNKSEPNLSIEESPKKQLTYKEFLSKEVDLKKVNNLDLTNKKLNKYERMERAKKYLPQSKPHVSANPAVLQAETMAEQAIRSRNPNVFKKYLNTLEYLERQAVEKEKQEKFEKKLSKSQIPATKGDSIDLLSSCIKSKLKILSNS